MVNLPVDKRQATFYPRQFYSSSESSVVDFHMGFINDTFSQFEFCILLIEFYVLGIYCLCSSIIYQVDQNVILINSDLLIYVNN